MTDDPTYGRIDQDIQEMVDRCEPKDVGQRVAMENTLQARRNAQWDDDKDGPFIAKRPCPTKTPEPHLLGEFPMSCYHCHVYADS